MYVCTNVCMYRWIYRDDKFVVKAPFGAVVPL